MKVQLSFVFIQLPFSISNLQPTHRDVTCDTLERTTVTHFVEPFGRYVLKRFGRTSRLEKCIRPHRTFLDEVTNAR